MMTFNTMMKTVCIILLLSLLLVKDIVVGDPEIEIFTCARWGKDKDKGKEKWIPCTSFEQGQKAMLKCVVSGNEDQRRTCFISKTDGEPLQRSEDNPTYLTHQFDKIDCSMLGSYQCTCKNNTSRPKIVELGVSACAPRFCNDGDELKTSEYVAINETKTISRCIMAYKGIMETAHLNGVPGKANKSPEGKKWSWWYENGPFSKYTVYIQLGIVSEQDYGEHIFTVFSKEGEQYKMNYTIELKKPVLPECPKQVNVTEIGTNHVSLTWAPQSSVSTKQTFHVLRSKDSATWRMVLRVEEARATISDLNESTDYCFRVVSSNIYGEAVGCEEWKYARTGSASSGGRSVVESLLFVVILATAGLWLPSL